jgi:hypothetical protein
MKRNFRILLLFVNFFCFAQVPFQHISNSTFNAERVANFGVIDVTTDFLEITNSTVNDNSFIPSIWAHQQSDNRYVLRHFATTNSIRDNGTIPLMIFRAELRDNLNFNAPIGGSFPWGTVSSNVVNRPLFAWENGNTQLMRILSNGYVGINTTIPTAIFHTNGTIRFENLPISTTNTYVLTADLNGNVSKQLSTSFGGNGLINNCNIVNYVLKKGATDFTCSQIFDNSVGVGIGTNNPTSLFHTNGTLRFENLSDSTSPSKILGTDNIGNVFEYNLSEFISSGSNDFDWLKPDGTFPTSINDNIYTNGNVGINVVNPTANLNTNGTLRFENLSDSTSPFKILGTDNIGNVFEYNPSELISSGSNDFDWLKPDGTFPTSINDNIYTNGNVGINIVNPTANLNTNGTLKFENLPDSTSPIKVLGTDSFGNVFEYNPSELYGAVTGDSDWLKSDGSLPTSINDNIYTNGKVGINTSSFPNQVGDVDVSSYSLYAKGGILTEEVRVALSSGWADFVFDQNYKLESLKDVEMFIKENKHLKDVPSAKEVELNGIELAEMNKILLQKIEELTLYMIDLNNKIDQQKEEIEKLKSNGK